MLRPIVIAIAGGSASGKTTLANEIARTFDACLVHLDDFYHPGWWHDHGASMETVDFDTPEAFDLGAAADCIHALRQGHPQSVRTWDHARHRHGRLRLLQPRPLIILEGLHALHPRVPSSIIDLAIYIDTREDVAYQRRVARDAAHRANSPELNARYYQRCVRPAQVEHIAPSRLRADRVLDGIDLEADLEATRQDIESLLGRKKS